MKKFRNPGGEHTSTLLDSLLQECILFSRLRHPNVVLFLGICTEEPNVVRAAEHADSQLTTITNENKGYDNRIHVHGQPVARNTRTWRP